MNHEVKLGEVLHGFHDRDAIHVAIVPCIVGEEYGMSPGERVRLAYGTTNVAIREGKEWIGVVDPYLEHHPTKGEQVYVFLKPGLVTGMKHQWRCPLFDSPQIPESEAERWLRKFADEWGFDYDEMLSIATSPMSGEWDDYITAHGRDLHSADELGHDLQLFWDNVQALTGRTFDQEHRDKIGWSCSC